MATSVPIKLHLEGVVNPIVGNEIMFVNELTECYFH